MQINGVQRLFHLQVFTVLSARLTLVGKTGAMPIKLVLISLINFLVRAFEQHCRLVLRVLLYY